MDRELLEQLSQPFEPNDISWLPGRTTKDGLKVQAMAYADLRAYMERLDEVVGGEWQVNYTPWGDRIICNLTILGRTRSSTGEPDSNSERNEIGGCVAEAQAFKRACAMFGLGRYLYNLPSVWVAFDKDRKQITDEGKRQLDAHYQEWYRKAMAQCQKPAQNGRASASSVSEATIPPNAPQRAATPATEPTNDAAEAAQLRDSAEPIDPDPAPSPAPRGVPITEATLKRLHALGERLYGANWDAKRRELVEHVSRGAVQSSTELTENEARRLCAGMEAKIAKLRQPDAALWGEAA